MRLVFPSTAGTPLEPPNVMPVMLHEAADANGRAVG
jgi:hypothetical protein